ncbi:REP element-mobilizing transposase RayT [Lishizhenia tianjinensis]|uniref:REP element-mobilizing transposase RayT n=1 Tax=Lishizhenia tianjinensis TaxID=477690 RepID=A0A1I7B0U5_9FLAO|nr:transposase [Lishizhenia tianjinensis]SFT80752.1 REP element-mobilizing transposase RayT [Lishizhenia tianjinensis]
MKPIDRRSIRAKFINYSEKGYYFITIKTYRNQPLFGYIHQGEMQTNPAGNMIESALIKIVNDFKELQCHHYIIMPDHLHFIFQLTQKMDIEIISSNTIQTPKGVQICIQRFKSFSTNLYIKVVNKGIFSPFRYKLWHRNYYERLIRSERELKNVINYIQNNPRNWENDIFTTC